MRRVWIYGNGRGRQKAWALAAKAGHQLRRNMVRRRLLSFPHLLIGLWFLVLLWGESWTFASKVNQCDWDHWEDWVSQFVLLARLPSMIDRPTTLPQEEGEGEEIAAVVTVVVVVATTIFVQDSYMVLF